MHLGPAAVQPLRRQALITQLYLLGDHSMRVKFGRQILQLFLEAAANGSPCPSKHDIEDKCGLTLYQINDGLDFLVGAGRIEKRGIGNGQGIYLVDEEIYLAPKISFRSNYVRKMPISSKVPKEEEERNPYNSGAIVDFACLKPKLAFVSKSLEEQALEDDIALFEATERELMGAGL